MVNILAYLNTFFNYIFGIEELLLTPSVCISSLSSLWSSILNNSDVTYKLFAYLGALVSQPALVLSVFVWVWFAILALHLLLIFPYRWLRSVIRKCRGC